MRYLMRNFENNDHLSFLIILVKRKDDF